MILRLLIFWALLYFGYRAIKTIMFGALTHQHREPLHNHKQQTVIDEMVQDPICGVYFPRKDGVRATIKGQELLFCSKKCKDKFLEQQS